MSVIDKEQVWDLESPFEAWYPFRPRWALLEQRIWRGATLG